MTNADVLDHYRNILSTVRDTYWQPDSPQYPLLDHLNQVLLNHMAGEDHIVLTAMMRLLEDYARMPGTGDENPDFYEKMMTVVMHIRGDLMKRGDLRGEVYRMQMEAIDEQLSILRDQNVSLPAL